LNQITDGAAPFVETLAYQIYSDFGILAPRTSYAVLSVNGKSLGIYRVVEADSESILERKDRETISFAGIVSAPGGNDEA
jgi:spore coat protein CotH